MNLHETEEASREFEVSKENEGAHILCTLQSKKVSRVPTLIATLTKQPQDYSST